MQYTSISSHSLKHKSGIGSVTAESVIQLVQMGHLLATNRQPVPNWSPQHSVELNVFQEIQTMMWENFRPQTILGVSRETEPLSLLKLDTQHNSHSGPGMKEERREDMPAWGETSFKEKRITLYLSAELLSVVLYLHHSLWVAGTLLLFTRCSNNPPSIIHLLTFILPFHLLLEATCSMPDIGSV